MRLTSTEAIAKTSNFPMIQDPDFISYCINPKCCNRQNPDSEQHCQTCGTPLLVHHRYRLVRPLRELHDTYNTELFEVEDWAGDIEDLATPKILKVLKSNNLNFIRQFKQEARALIWLKHPAIPTVEPDGYFTFSIGTKVLHCLVMEKIEGLSLAQWLEQNGPISSELAFNWLQQLAEILAEVHKHGLVHRDIKPSNIMLKPDGKLALIDFGAVGDLQPSVKEICSFGSIGYTAPEQIKGETVVASDFFALGRTMVHLLTGRSPMDFPENAETGNPIWRESAATACQPLLNLIDWMMAKQPQNRPENIQVILQYLEARSSNSIILSGASRFCRGDSIPAGNFGF